MCHSSFYMKTGYTSNIVLYNILYYIISCLTECADKEAKCGGTVWKVTLCRLVCTWRRFGGTYCFNFQVPQKFLYITVGSTFCRIRGKLGLKEGCKNPGRLNFVTWRLILANICWSSGWKLLCVISLVSVILMLHQDFFWGWGRFLHPLTNEVWLPPVRKMELARFSETFRTTCLRIPD